MPFRRKREFDTTNTEEPAARVTRTASQEANVRNQGSEPLMSELEQNPREPELLPRASLESQQAIPTIPVHRGDDDQLYIPVPPVTRRSKRRTELILFLLTCASTFYAGYENLREPVGIAQLPDGRQIVLSQKTYKNGLLYSLGVMAILGAHEMGHYLQARRYGVPASLPMFIPMPFGPFGTMGAVIVQQAGVANRKSMFDIAISGPLAGLVIAIPLAWWGISMSRVETFEPIPGVSSQIFPDPLLLKWIVRSYFGELKPNQDVVINPILFAGWVGFFITGLNLIPIGQLDGGHILFCLVKKRAHRIARALFLGAAAVVAYSTFFGDQSYTGWWLMLALIWMMGTRHPPTADDQIPLGLPRVILGWVTLLFIFIGFSPRPPYEVRGPNLELRAPLPAPKIQGDPENARRPFLPGIGQGVPPGQEHETEL
jgi:membrane-associated protease RseP (regulator of RpoE activity)